MYVLVRLMSGESFKIRFTVLMKPKEKQIFWFDKIIGYVLYLISTFL